MTSNVALGAAVFDLDGTLVEAMPYQELLIKIAQTVNCQVEALLKYYYENPFLLDDARNYHLSLCINEDSKKIVLSDYDEFLKAKEHPAVLSGAKELLELLKKRKLVLICWTRGELKKQSITLSFSGLKKYFDEIIAVPEKTAETVVNSLLPVVDKREFVLIGDSYKQDILPALPFAKKLFWVAGSRVNKLGLGVAPVEPLPDKVVKINTVADLLK